jgi:cytochrome P450
MKPTDDPFKSAREAGPVVGCEFQGKPVPMLLGHKAIRDAARDWKTLSSNAAFRVPIPSEETVRSVRQLPIETDPPEHTEYRRIIEPFFNRPREPEMQERIRALIDALLAAAMAEQAVEVVGQIALPLQSRALAILLGVPENEADEWIGWGVNVLRDKELSVEKGARLEEYIHEKLDLAATDPGLGLFSTLVRAEFRGRPLTRGEMLGFANLVFAGGRDTVIHSVSSIIAHVADHPATLAALREDPKRIMSATEELMRHLSPLAHIGRVCTHGADLHGTRVTPDQSVSLCWASANRDPAVFDSPDEFRLDRKPNPHIAFGSGAHTCIGALHARVLFRTLLQWLVDHVSHIEVIERQEHIESISQFERPLGYDKLVVRLVGRD